MGDTNAAEFDRFCDRVGSQEVSRVLTEQWPTFSKNNAGLQRMVIDPGEALTRYRPWTISKQLEVERNLTRRGIPWFLIP
jgi:hypothetical protein